MDLESFKGADYWTLRRVIAYLKAEHGSISADVALLCGLSVTVWADGRITEPSIDGAAEQFLQGTETCTGSTLGSESRRTA